MSKTEPYRYPGVVADDADRMAKTILDLDGLVRALIKSIRPSLPWQRRLLNHLSEADRALQVLRMSVAMGRDMQELIHQAAQVRKLCTNFKAAIAGSRVDEQTRIAIELANSLAVGLGEALRKA